MDVQSVAPKGEKMEATQKGQEKRRNPEKMVLPLV
jgi:hypothetical protein